MKNIGFQKAIKNAGGQANFADFLADGTVQSTVSKWDELPPEHVLKTEKRYGVPRYELRPDIYPPEEFKNVDHS